MEELVKVCVKPNSAKSEVVGWEGDCLVVRVDAPPERGKANKELIKLLKKYFKAKDIEIVKGATSKVKLIRVVK
ncbi:hypothetical protein EYM_04550 [Ignicoccus islandicus DSM 13165]|uniref:UPF0235 protein EYM_04550 n=1 Tax=Ignicoccus islandicus DSM 13165 TaxID=940295 RepID=A0A0U3DWB3_9CREN|nr:DUF167 domain-containing protein [Ignicoccus islandicus]ALU11770.1 hypothetical protein EYM_04550 [Ignicoccus islandicus DSM 13165]